MVDMIGVPGRHPLMPMGGRHDDVNGDGSTPAILCATATTLFDLVIGSSRECAVTDRMGRIGAISLDGPLSLPRVIRANFAIWIGILEGNKGREAHRPATTC
jgi:hypothetical protein